MIREVWAPLYGYEDEYMISTHGRVLSKPRVVMRSDGSRLPVPGRIIKKCRDSCGYLNFTVRRDGVMKTMRVHIAVLKSFVGPPPEGHEACHWDDDKTNNHLDNLRWATRSDNTRDMIRNGNHPQARKTHCPRGHEYDEENTYLHPRRNARVCKTCQRAAIHRHRAAKRQQQQPNQEGVS